MSLSDTSESPLFLPGPRLKKPEPDILVFACVAADVFEVEDVTFAALFAATGFATFGAEAGCDTLSRTVVVLSLSASEEFRGGVEAGVSVAADVLKENQPRDRVFLCPDKLVCSAVSAAKPLPPDTWPEVSSSLFFPGDSLFTSLSITLSGPNSANPESTGVSVGLTMTLVILDAGV